MKNKAAVITIISILISPLYGALIGKIFGRLLLYNHLYFEDGLSYLAALTLIVASIVFYVENRDR